MSRRAREDDLSYFRRRALEELAAAESAPDGRAAAAHEHLAARYAAALGEMSWGLRTAEVKVERTITATPLGPRS